MSRLNEFAAFVRSHHLDTFVDQYLKLLFDHKLPVLKLLSHIPKEELRKMNRQRSIDFLTGLENGTAFSDTLQNLKRWQSGEITEIPVNAISAPELILIYSIQKKALLRFLPLFMTGSTETISLIQELDSYYTRIQEEGVNLLFRALHESEQNYKDLFDNSNDLIHILSREGSILYVNTAWQQAMEYTAAEVKGKSIFTFMNEKDAEKYATYRNRLIEGKTPPLRIQVCLTSKSGRTIFLEGEISVRLLDEQELQTRGIFRDISFTVVHQDEVNQFTREINERKMQMENIIANAPDAVVVIDPESRIIKWNPKAETIFGWPEHEVIDKPIQEIIIPHQYREAHIRGMKHYLKTGEGPVLNKSIEITALNKAGREFNISLSISASTHKESPVFIAFIRDISEQVITRKKLEEKTELLEKSNQELEQFASVASHDLQEPLRTVSSYLELLERKYKSKLDNDATRYIRITVDASRRMKTLIESLLEYSRLNRQEKSVSEIDMHRLLDEVLQSLNLLIKETNTHVDIEYLPSFRGDYQQMLQLFQNLINNSIKFRRKNVPSVIKISGRRGENQYQFCVKDNGIGIENRYVKKIFEIFKRLHTREEYPGTGIGLAVCKKIVEKHGGEIWINSQPGQGTEVCFTISAE